MLLTFKFTPNNPDLETGVGLGIFYFLFLFLLLFYCIPWNFSGIHQFQWRQACLEDIKPYSPMAVPDLITAEFKIEILFLECRHTSSRNQAVLTWCLLFPHLISRCSIDWNVVIYCILHINEVTTKKNLWHISCV